MVILKCKRLTEVVGEHRRLLDDVVARVARPLQGGAGVTRLEATGAGGLPSAVGQAGLLRVGVVPEVAR